MPSFEFLTLFSSVRGEEEGEEWGTKNWEGGVAEGWGGCGAHRLELHS